MTATVELVSRHAVRRDDEQRRRELAAGPLYWTPELAFLWERPWRPRRRSISASWPPASVTAMIPGSTSATCSLACPAMLPAPARRTSRPASPPLASRLIFPGRRTRSYWPANFFLVFRGTLTLFGRLALRYPLGAFGPRPPFHEMRQIDLDALRARRLGGRKLVIGVQSIDGSASLATTPWDSPPRPADDNLRRQSSPH